MLEENGCRFGVPEEGSKMERREAVRRPKLGRARLRFEQRTQGLDVPEERGLEDIDRRLGTKQDLDHVHALRVACEDERRNAGRGACRSARRVFAQQLFQPDRVAALKLPTAVCTIYEARYEDPDLRKIAAAGLAIFNDIILREALLRGLPVIDLRIMFDDDADYANAIEPSVKGGEKIARAISTLVETHDFTRRRSAIYV